MNIYSLLDESAIVANMQVNSKKELIDELVNLLDDKLSSEQLEKIRSAVFEREQIMSTGVGKQLAIPHGKCPSIDENYASFAMLENPVDYDSIDNQPVRLAFLLVGPSEKSNSHIKLLSRISRLMNSSTFRDKLIECESAEQIYKTFQDEEIQYFGS